MGRTRGLEAGRLRKPADASAEGGVEPTWPLHPDPPAPKRSSHTAPGPAGRPRHVPARLGPPGRHLRPTRDTPTARLGSEMPPFVWSGRGPQEQVPADTTRTQIPTGRGRKDRASLARMSWASGPALGLHLKCRRQSGSRKQPLYRKPARALCGVAPGPQNSTPPRGQIIPRRASCQSPGCYKVVSPALRARQLLQESPYWAPGFRSNVPLKGPDGTLCPCPWSA